MTVSSPTPQQQNRWKGRRCLAAALIPQPAAYPPKHICCSLPRNLFHTLSVGKRSQQAATNTAFSSRSERLVFQVVSKNQANKKSREGEAAFPPPDSGHTRRCFSPPHLRAAHSQRTLLRACEHSERSTADPTVSCSNRRRHALSALSLSSLSAPRRALPLCGHQEATNSKSPRSQKKGRLCHLNYFCVCWLGTLFSLWNNKTYSPRRMNEVIACQWEPHAVPQSPNMASHFPPHAVQTQMVLIENTWSSYLGTGTARKEGKMHTSGAQSALLHLNCLVHAKLPVWLRIGCACQVASGTFGIGCF